MVLQHRRRKGSGDLPGLQSRRFGPLRVEWWVRLPHASAKCLMIRLPLWESEPKFYFHRSLYKSARLRLDRLPSITGHPPICAQVLRREDIYRAMSYRRGLSYICLTLRTVAYKRLRTGGKQRQSPIGRGFLSTRRTARRSEENKVDNELVEREKRDVPMSSEHALGG